MSARETNGPSRGRPRPPNEINRDPSLSAGRLPTGRRPVSPQIASRVGSRQIEPGTRSILLRRRSPTGRRLALRVSAAFSGGERHRAPPDAAESSSSDPRIRDVGERSGTVDLCFLVYLVNAPARSSACHPFRRSICAYKARGDGGPSSPVSP